MAHPFETRNRRRGAVLVGLWGIAVASIISYVTMRSGDGLVKAVLSLGAVYQRSRIALDVFAANATVPAATVHGLYLVLGTLVVALSVYLLDAYAFENRPYVRESWYGEDARLYDEGSFVTALVGLALIAGIIVVGSAVFLFGPSAVVTFALASASQLLVLAAFSLIISLVTVYVP